GYTAPDESRIYVDAGVWFQRPWVTSVETGINDTIDFAANGASQQFWYNWFVDLVASNGSIPLIIRESPGLNNIAWSGTIQTRYDTFQTFVATNPHGYLYVDQYDGGGHPPTSRADGGGSSPSLWCGFDI